MYNTFDNNTTSNRVKYLNEDGIKLPKVPNGMTVSPFDPRHEKPIADDDEWNDYEDDDEEEEEEDNKLIIAFLNLKIK